MSFNWFAIRSLGGSQNNGFEELCCQFARAESPETATFVRKGTPDAGVECYCQLDNREEWAWQAKYFTSFGNSQWVQLDDSVRTALDKHPLLRKYYICVPLDRPDARTGTGMSAQEKWDARVEKWIGWAEELDMSVEFIYWGSSELLDRLMLPQHAGKQLFWFREVGFDQNWFERRLESAVATAGPRYTPEVHIELPIAEDFETFGRTEYFLENAKAQIKNIRDKKRSFEYSLSKIDRALIEEPLAHLLENIQTAESHFRDIAYQPTGSLIFHNILQLLEKSLESIDILADILEGLDAEEQAREPEKYTGKVTSFRAVLGQLYSFMRELREIESILDSADRVASGSVLIVNGDAGSGKTHLLCDIAKQRIENKLPTVLLMGHQFTTLESPWNQARSHLDLPVITLDEFVGAFESAAQIANCRALIMIDAVNEGTGRELWPVHMQAFLEAISKSPWIGVVFSVRTSYINIIPNDIKDSASLITHRGFEDNEYDAVKSFFLHYDLELPSVPLITPEFRNPLFLKTLCSGLKTSGHKRLPRGLHGITGIFQLFLSSINQVIAKELDYRPSREYVFKAMSVLAEKMVELDARWIDLDLAEEIVNALHPSRGYENSLYRKLVVAGLIGEEVMWAPEGEDKEVVYIAYERLADHLIAKYLLDRYLDENDPSSSFKEGGELSFLLEDKYKNEEGLLEALCIQIPEQTTHELISLAPKFSEHWGILEAYLNSFVWRSLAAFTDESHDILNKLIRSEHNFHRSLDVMLIVAIIPEHPFNAAFLHDVLQKKSMAERDHWWSIFLHTNWTNKGSAYRLVDWALSVTEFNTIEDDVVELATTILAWFLTSSNRYLRDKASKALVNLLSGRFELAEVLINKFSEVNDPYVAERVYAAVYGVAMRCSHGDNIKQIAQCVYENVFAENNPPVHILLRDYARGIIERALYLQVDIQIDTSLIRPPYRSDWPEILSEEAIEEFLPDWSKGSYDSGEAEWSRNRIGTSVMNDDFARYVIGTNTWSTDFLSLKLDEAVWQSPEERLEQLIKGFSLEELELWQAFELADQAVTKMRTDNIILVLRSSSLGESQKPEMKQAQSNRNEAYGLLQDKMSEELWVELEQILKDKDSGQQRQPRFDLKQVQRYILQRVFTLGWTTEFFGDFDRFTIESEGREASKAERIGKKYQWIAYHEIMAYISDHYQYREEYAQVECGRHYDGPWQLNLHDIDPSITLQSTTRRALRAGDNPSWWHSESYDSWGGDKPPEAWVSTAEDLPSIESILLVKDEDETEWLNAHSFLDWKMPIGLEDELEDSERREIWYIVNAYLIHVDDVDEFLNWSETVDFTGRWMPEPQNVHEQYFGEYAWSSSARCHRQLYYGDLGWHNPEKGCPVKLQVVASEYSADSSSFDCSVDDGFNLLFPHAEISTRLGLSWSGKDANFHDLKGVLATYDPAVRTKGPNSLLIRKDLIEALAEQEEITICWTVIGEKRAYISGFAQGYNHTLFMNGAYVFQNSDIKGSFRINIDLSKDEE